MSGLDSENRKDYSKYDEMSTEYLEELLRLDAELPDGEGADINEILYISEVIAKRDNEHPTGRYSEADVDAAWETFQTKYLPYATDGRSLYDFDDDEHDDTEVTDISLRHSKKHTSPRSKHILKRVVSIAAVIALLLGITTATAHALGYDLWEVVAQWTKDAFMFVSTSKVNDVENANSNSALNEKEYADLQAALDAYGITEQLVPKWLPDGFEVENVYVDEYSGPMAVIFQSNYKCGERTIIIQLNLYRDTNDISYTDWEKDNIDIRTLEIENCTFYMTKNAERECAIWLNGPFECSIIGDISSEELTKVIKSIY